MLVPAEEHRSADGALIFAVDALEDGDVAIGFRNFPWHTHADILSSMRCLPEPAAVRSFVDELLSDDAVIAMRYIDNVLSDVWVSEDARRDLRYCEPNERIEFRYWSGTSFSPPST